MAGLATLPVPPLVMSRIRLHGARSPSVIDGRQLLHPTLPQLGHNHLGRLLTPKGAEYPPFTTAQVHARGGSPPERVRDRPRCNPAPLQGGWQ